MRVPPSSHSSQRSWDVRVCSFVVRQSNQRVTLQIPLQTTDNYETTYLIILEKEEQQQTPTGKSSIILMVALCSGCFDWIWSLWTSCCYCYNSTSKICKEVKSILTFLVNPIWHGRGYFYPHVIFGSDFISWFFFKKFQTFLKVKIETNRVILTPYPAHWIL